MEVCHEGTCSQVAYPSDRIGHRDRAGVGGGRIRRRVALGARTVPCDERRHALSLARRIVAKETEREVHSPRHDDSYGQCGLLGRAFEALCERGYRRSGAINIANAAATTALATYVVDYHVVPKRITPGFESHLSKDSLGLTYVALGAGFALAAVLRLVHDADRVAALELPSTGRNSSFAGLSCADTSGR